MTYYNTGQLTGAQLKEYLAVAGQQSRDIAEFFRERRGTPTTPSEVHEALYGNTRTPITSVRRSITALTQANVLVKLETQRDGPWGRPEYEWVMPAEQAHLHEQASLAL